MTTSVDEANPALAHGKPTTGSLKSMTTGSTASSSAGALSTQSPPPGSAASSSGLPLGSANSRRSGSSATPRTARGASRQPSRELSRSSFLRMRQPEVVVHTDRERSLALGQVDFFLQRHGFSGINSERYFKRWLRTQCPLHVAVRERDHAAIRQLLIAGADATATDSAGRTPLELASTHNRDGSQTQVLIALMPAPAQKHRIDVRGPGCTKLAVIVQQHAL
mmetsp:Transcript_5784/g.17067  ORF Transcript_5784/g.17067 Transcript_5784/m.17067 type:complete len:222 (+) Transcript_5784:55-720(+)